MNMASRYISAGPQFISAGMYNALPPERPQNLNAQRASMGQRVRKGKMDACGTLVLLPMNDDE
jgi:hypothetical protein